MIPYIILDKKNKIIKSIYPDKEHFSRKMLSLNDACLTDGLEKDNKKNIEAIPIKFSLKDYKSGELILNCENTTSLNYHIRKIIRIFIQKTLNVENAISKEEENYNIFSQKVVCEKIDVSDNYSIYENGKNYDCIEKTSKVQNIYNLPNTIWDRIFNIYRKKNIFEKTIEGKKEIIKNAIDNQKNNQHAYYIIGDYSNVQEPKLNISSASYSAPDVPRGNKIEKYLDYETVNFINFIIDNINLTNLHTRNLKIDRSYIKNIMITNKIIKNLYIINSDIENLNKIIEENDFERIDILLNNIKSNYHIPKKVEEKFINLRKKIYEVLTFNNVKIEDEKIIGRTNIRIKKCNLPNLTEITGNFILLKNNTLPKIKQVNDAERIVFKNSLYPNEITFNMKKDKYSTLHFIGGKDKKIVVNNLDRLELTDKTTKNIERVLKENAKNKIQETKNLHFVLNKSCELYIYSYELRNIIKEKLKQIEEKPVKIDKITYNFLGDKKEEQEIIEKWLKKKNITFSRTDVKKRVMFKE